MRVVFGKLDVTVETYISAVKLEGAGLLLTTGELVFGKSGGGNYLWQVSREGDVTQVPVKERDSVVALAGARWLFEPHGPTVDRSGDFPNEIVVFENGCWGLALKVAESNISYWDFISSTPKASDGFSFRAFDSWTLTAVSSLDRQRVLVQIKNEPD